MPADRAMIKLHDNYCEMLFVKSLSVIVQVWDEEPCRWKNRNFCKFGDKFNFPFSYLTSSSADPSFHLALPAEMRRKEGERRERERERERCSNSSSNTTLGLPFPPTSHSVLNYFLELQCFKADKVSRQGQHLLLLRSLNWTARLTEACGVCSWSVVIC